MTFDETVKDSRVIEGLACRAGAGSDSESASADVLRRDSLCPDGSGGRGLEMDIVSHDVKKFFDLLLA